MLLLEKSRKWKPMWRDKIDLNNGPTNKQFVIHTFLRKSTTDENTTFTLFKHFLKPNLQNNGYCMNSITFSSIFENQFSDTEPFQKQISQKCLQLKKQLKKSYKKI